jgi:ribonuclease P protein component
VIVPRFGHTAVARNVVKRRLRDLARVELLPALATLAATTASVPLDVVIRAAPSAYDADFDMLRAAVLQALKKLSRGPAEGTP